MIYLRLAIALVLLFGGPAQAREVLPVAMGHQSAGFYLDGKSARLPIGARVEFIYRDEKGIPKRLPHTTGLVLGARDNVVFFELSVASAIRLAERRAFSKVTFQKVKDPVPEEVKVRREYSDSGLAVRLAPQMRRLTISASIDADTVAGWSPGEMLTFYDAGQYSWSKKYHDVEAMFRSATKVEDGQFELMVVADPSGAGDILRAELEGRLNVDPETEARRKEAGERRCYVARRSGVERIQVHVPCVNEGE